MDDERLGFLKALLDTPSPSGFEAAGQRLWVDYVGEFADEVRTDAYGNAVAVYEGSDDGPELAFAGHADEIGFIVTRIGDEGYEDEGFVNIAPIGGSDPTVTRGQHVEIHTDDGPVNGVIGQVAIHLRDGEDDVDDIAEMYVDVGAEDEAAARGLVEVGDPVTFATTLRELDGTRLAARGMDNRVGVWTAAEALRQAAEAGVDATVYAVSTVQEEVGVQGAKMVGFDLDPDAIVAIDVTHAVDAPSVERSKHGEVEVGEGPVVGRGSANHPVVVQAVREAAEDAGIDVQLQAAGTRTGTDADAFYTQRSGIPALNLSIPNRYMHTPVEVVDTDDLTDAAALLAAFADYAADFDGFSVQV